MPKTDYELKIDDQDVEKSLKDTQDEFDKMAKAGDDAMKKVGKSAEELGDGIRRNVNGRLIDANGKFIKMGDSGDKAMKKVSKGGLNMSHVMSGAVGGAFTALAGAAIEFGKAAVNAFADVIKSAAQAAVEFDVTRRKFISIFEGQEGPADAVMDKISQRASELGLDMNEALSISRSFLPDVKGTEDPLGAIDDLLVGVRALAEEDPAQGIIGARVAIDEAMSGSLRSLKARFEFTKAEIDILKDAQKEFGQVVGTIEGINKVMARRGVDVEALKGTFTQALGEMQFATGKLRVELGKPIADQMTESMTDLNKILAENSDDLLLLSGTMGDLVATVLEFIGTKVTDFLEDFDVSGLNDAAILFGDIVNEVLTLADILFELEVGEGMFDDLNTFLETIKKVLDTLNQVVAITKAVNESDTNVIAAAFEARSRQNLANKLELEDAGKSFSFFYAQVTEEAIASSEAATKSFETSFAKIEEGRDRAEKNAEARAARRAKQDIDTGAALVEAEAFLKEGDAASETAKALAELGLAEEDLEKIQEDVIKTQEKLVKAGEKFAQERLDIARDFLQERADLELEFSQERADITRQSLEDIAAIETDHRQAIEDQGLQLSRNARDLGKKQGKERADAEKDLRQDLLDVEQNFQDELRRIQRTAQQAMEEAERGLDAQAFVAALRQQEVSLEEAAITREGAEADVRDEASQRLEDLEQAQAEERAALRQADQDKLEDLQIQLTREFEAQALSDQLAFEQQAIDENRRLEQQVTSEQRRLEEQAIDEQRQLEALVQAQAERLAKMVEGLDAETAAVVLAEANKLAAVEDFAGSAQAVLDGLVANAKSRAKEVKKPEPESIPSPRPRPGRPRLGGVQEDAGNVVPDKPGLFLPIIQKRRGGGVRAGHPYRVGEIGLEGYIPHRAFGGDTRIGQPTIVGEFGEELFIPPSSGTIIPNKEMSAFLGNTTNMQQSISNTQNNLGGFSVSQSMFEDPIQRGQLENFILDVMSRN